MRSLAPSLAAIVLAACTCGAASAPIAAPPPTPPTIPAAVDPPEPAPHAGEPEIPEDGPAALGEARRLARAGDHAAAIARLDEVLAAQPDDARALAMRGYSRLFVRGAEARAAARADLERALELSAGDAHLAAAIELDLGLLDDREGSGELARMHYQRANRLRPSDAAVRYGSGLRECSLDVHAEDGPTMIAATWVEAADVVDYDDRTAEHATDADARAWLCGEESPCAEDAPSIGIVDANDGPRASVFVPLADGRLRVVRDVLESPGREPSCGPLVEHAFVDDARWRHARIDIRDGHTGVGGCVLAAQRHAEVFVNPADGTAIWIVSDAERVDASEGRAVAYLEVDVEVVGSELHILGCGADRRFTLAR